MEDISQNSRTLAQEIEEKRIALGSILGFFQGLPERLNNELTQRYEDAQEKYAAVAERTLPALVGTENDNARHAREYITNLVELNPSWLPISRMETDRGNLEEVVGTLQRLDGELSKMEGGLRQGAGNALACISTAHRAESSLIDYFGDIVS